LKGPNEEGIKQKVGTNGKQEGKGFKRPTGPTQPNEMRQAQ